MTDTSSFEFLVVFKQLSTEPLFWMQEKAVGRCKVGTIWRVFRNRKYSLRQRCDEQRCREGELRLTTFYPLVAFRSHVLVWWTIRSTRQPNCWSRFQINQFNSYYACWEPWKLHWFISSGETNFSHVKTSNTRVQTDRLQIN